MGIEQGQCLLRRLSGRFLAPVPQVRLGEVLIGIGRIRIGQQHEPEDRHGGLGIAPAQVVLADRGGGDLREQLRLRVLAACLPEQFADLCDASRCAHLVEKGCGRQGVCGGVAGGLDQGRDQPVHDEIGQLGMGLEQVGAVVPRGRNLADVERLVPEPTGRPAAPSNARISCSGSTP